MHAMFIIYIFQTNRSCFYQCSIQFQKNHCQYFVELPTLFTFIFALEIIEFEIRKRTFENPGMDTKYNYY